MSKVNKVADFCRKGLNVGSADGQALEVNEVSDCLRHFLYLQPSDLQVGGSVLLGPFYNI